MIQIKSLNKSEQFKYVLNKRRIHNDYFSIYYAKNVSEHKNSKLNISFLIKKKVGNAVKRNKIKRRLKGAVQKISKTTKLIKLDQMYVLFGKKKIYEEKFSNLFDEMVRTFELIKEKK